MGVINKGHTFVSGENVTADKLNNLADDATFNSSSTDGTTLEVADPGGYIKVKDAGIDAQHLANDSVTTDKITNANVTYAKIQNVAANSVIGNPTASDATPQAISIADLSTDVVAAISDATAHNATPVNGLNTTGGTEGLMSANDKTKLDGLAAGTGLKLTGATFSLDDTAPTSALTSAPTGKTGGYMTAYRQVTNSSGGGASTSNRVAASWFHYGDAHIQFDPTDFFDHFGNKVPATANWAVMQILATTTDLDEDGNAMTAGTRTVVLGVATIPNQGSSFVNKNILYSNEALQNATTTGISGSIHNSYTDNLGSWASAGGTYQFQGAHQVYSLHAHQTEGHLHSGTFLAPIMHNGSNRSVQLVVDYANHGTGTNGQFHSRECSGFQMYFIGFIE